MVGFFPNSEEVVSEENGGCWLCNMVGSHQGVRAKHEYMNSAEEREITSKNVEFGRIQYDTHITILTPPAVQSVACVYFFSSGPGYAQL